MKCNKTDQRSMSIAECALTDSETNCELRRSLCPKKMPWTYIRRTANQLRDRHAKAFLEVLRYKPMMIIQPGTAKTHYSG